MSAATSGKRFGLSFEAAPPPARSHPTRTDIACFVGCVARRRDSRAKGPQPLPPLLVRWLAGQNWPRVAGLETGTLQPDWSSATALRGALLDVIDAALDGLPPGDSPQRGRLLKERDRMVELWRSLDTARVNRLLAQCRDATPLSAALLDGLGARGFEPQRLLGPDATAAWQRVQALLNLPVALESFEQFQQLFAWEERPLLDRAGVEAGDRLLATPLGAAVRAFFAEGGRTCYVIRTGDPVELFAAADRRMAALTGGAKPRPRSPGEIDRAERVAAVPGIGLAAGAAGVRLLFEPVATDAALWQGIEHLYGLSEVSFVCLPDLVDACAQGMPSLRPPQKLVIEEAFRECAAPEKREPEGPGRRLSPPQLDRAGLEAWRACLMHALRLLDNDGRAFNRRDIQVLASLPLTGEGPGTPSADEWIAWMHANGWLAEGARAQGTPLIEARLQLAFPWLRTRNSADCQGGIEAPEGTLAGVLARSALLHGSYRLAANQPVAAAYDIVPALDLTRAAEEAVRTGVGELSLAERVCLIAPSRSGFELMTDVTCAGELRLRPGSVRRLINVVVRAARAIGEELAFEPNGEVLWDEIRVRLSDLGRLLLAAGALSGNPASAFLVRCGRDTMTQNDIDAGRLIAEIELAPAQPVTRIAVVLALREAQSPTLVRRAA